MPDSLVLDASVAAKLYFTEELSVEAESAVRAADYLLAPELLFLELASVAVKQVRRGLTTIAAAEAAMTLMHGLVDEVARLEPLAERALELAIKHGVSAYDGAYLALAEDRRARVLTADTRLVRRATDQGLLHLIEPLAG
jgi:predicted nucleic acid-binding protein